jgi:DNA modification methylase
MDAVMTSVINQYAGEHFTAYNGDCVEVVGALPSNSVGFSVYSPPFAHLFVYSDSERDMGNVRDEAEFKALYRHMVREKYRVTKPGRLTAVHCSDLPRTKSMHGVVGLYDFPSDIREVHEAEGWTFHSRITVWKDPVVEMQRTKALGLLYKQIQTDSTRCRQGMADYVMVFRKTPADEKDSDKVGQDKTLFPVDMWQQWASPVWMDIQQTNVLNGKLAREDKDERHLCPLQLDLIERCIRLWSNPGDVVLSPFMGIGSEGFMALKAGRRFVGSELKPQYFKHAVNHLIEAERETATGSLLNLMGTA